MSDPARTHRARQLRKESTDAERVMWRLLRGRRLAGFKFRRQHVVGPYFLDFYCPEAKLAIEVDGGGHAETKQANYDEHRSLGLEAEGIRVLRFWNHEVLRQRDAVVDAIHQALVKMSERS